MMRVELSKIEPIDFLPKKPRARFSVQNFCEKPVFRETPVKSLCQNVSHHFFTLSGFSQKYNAPPSTNHKMAAFKSGKPQRK
jgi:hypothetical protein